MALELESRRTAVAIVAVVIAILVSLVGAWVVIEQTASDPPHMRHLVIASGS